ncbi:FAD-dependent oxidoreductase [Lewinella sp. 4G2]|uniref:FAD-dependent oxidoreductase n=1 Tax=Lewinella sp. 4G2 TaxID=1803372 RepID=UPI0007E25621|nr:FAD-dependent oxidoreductase [Lewinella sp. 4G2]OAV45363.1 hypothetical protein A3850_013060 [Lewinella sp. 4G2]
MTPVFKLSNLPAGHTHQFDHGEYKVLLTNVDGEVYAVESKCSHFGLPLENAALCEHRLRCPFHHACFDVRTGAQIEAPGLDGIATFDVRVDGDDILVATEPKAASPLNPAPAAAPEKSDEGHYKYAIVGGGIAAANAVYGIREHDGEGSIVMITSEDLPPYDRTHVSKALLSGAKDPADLPLHSEEFYAKQGVVLLEKTTAESVDVREKKIVADGKTLTYDKVLLATGGAPRKLDAPGAKLGGIYTIRNARDGRRIREQVKKGTPVVIVGGSFIGLESAMSLGKQGGKITVISPEETLFEKQFGKEVGDFIQQLHEAAGVKFKLGDKVKEFEGKGSVRAVITEGGERLKADVVVVGIGVQPSTNYLTGLAANDDGGISVDNHLATSAPGTYVAGDIAEYPDRTGVARIEHWKVAAQQGRVAGRNMAGHAEPYTMLPFFWSNQQGTNLRYAGHATDFDQVLLDGVPGETSFIAYYVKGETLQAALGVKRDKDVAIIAEQMNAGKLPPVVNLVGTNWSEFAGQN